MQVHHHSAREILVERGPVLIRVIDGEQTGREQVDRARAILDRMLERYAAVAFLLVYEHGSPIPDRDDRRHISERFDPLGDRVIVAVACMGMGFWASTILQVASAFARVAGHPILLTTSLEAATEGLALELVGLDAAALAAVCQSLRGQVGAGFVAVRSTG